MLARTSTYILDGIGARRAMIECDVRAGLPSFTIIGLSDTAARELRETVRAAVSNAGYDFPSQRVTVNLAPSSLRRASPAVALPVALALLAASGQISATDVAKTTVYGELTLGGDIRGLPGTLAAAAAHDLYGGGSPLLHGGPALPHDIAPIPVLPVTHLSQIPGLLGRGHFDIVAYPERPAASLPDFSDVRGHSQAIYALTVAAAGGHHVLLRGAPGSGKVMLARRLTSILPELTEREQREVAIIHDAAGLGHHRDRPFRAPHHTISAAGLVGGGSPIRPGEATLAHHGVLALTDIAEFQRPALEALCAPLEDQAITLIRGDQAHRFPAAFQLVATAEPCPGGHPAGEQCHCTPETIARWQRRLSAPLLDRVSIVVDLQPADNAASEAPGPSSSTLRDRVTAAREFRAQRHALLGQSPAASINLAIGPISNAAEELLEDAFRAGTLSRRGRSIVVQIARTVADLAGDDAIDTDAVRTALELRAGRAAQPSRAA